MPHTKIKRPIKYFSLYKDYTEMAQNNRLFITTGGIALISPRENKAPIQFCNNNTFTN
jgi:hypothetical protein